ncbi:leucine--tRNA ligase [Candidatus Micrarchaeota archaeon]|nr:leucine--tRNA ligase [Candidatus Micrarchaeota archaeon]
MNTDTTDVDQVDKVARTNAIEGKWRKKWAEKKAFESDPEKNMEKYYLTAAFPYPNSPQHIGHARTYTTLDIHARYMRLKGYNVLLPMAFHVTGTPIIAMAQRIADKDEEVLKVFENIYGISRQTAATLTRPEDLVMHFSKEIEEGMREMGYSIDWRRKFYTFDKKFNRFIQWQFHKLKEHGLIVQGEHPIAWCPKDNQAVGAHDTKGDADPELKEFTAVKFAYGDGYILTATLRPETIYGVTNIWINPINIHVKAKSSKTNEVYYISKNAYEKMNYQNFDLEILEEFKGEKLISDKNKKAKNPITGEELPLYAAPYVKDDEGTGIVMSVPSHAPYDHIALLDMGIHLNYSQIIQVDGYKFMAKELIEKMGVKDQNDPKLDDIVSQTYKKEILTGVMLVGPYKGEKVSVAIEKTKKSILENNQALVFWELSNKPIYCRCGAHLTVNILGKQWFIDYENSTWKQNSHKCLDKMLIVPEKTRKEYDYAIDWFKQKACARSKGLGTPFPFEDGLVIEALSDSTIYMAFYTIAHLLKDFDEKEMTEEFFDYILLGKGKEKKEWKELRESFIYWYPLDARHSGADLVRNHLPFFIMNHVAIFPEKNWPKSIVTNGFVLMDGAKMSKSMGNILPLRKAIREYGADVIRFSVVCGADLSSDTDFNKSVADGVKSRLVIISDLIEKSRKNSKLGHTRPEKWLLSRLNRKIKGAEDRYQKLEIRQLALEIFYEVTTDLQWYLKRSEKPNLHDFFKKWVVAISPFMPHHAEEYWHLLGNKEFVSFEKFPKTDESHISDALEHGEELIQKVHADVEKISALIGKKPSVIKIFIASEWKREFYKLAKKHQKFDELMRAAAAEKMPMADVQRVGKQIMKNIHSLPDALSEKEEFEALNDAVGFLGKEFSCNIEVIHEDKADHPKAKAALPDKPAIVLE